MDFPRNHEANSKAKFNHQSSEWETFQPLRSLGLLGCVCLSLALPSCCPPCSCYSPCSPLPQSNLSSPALMFISQLGPFHGFSSPGRETKGFTPSLWAHSCTANSSGFHKTGCSPLQNQESTPFTEEGRSVPARGVQPRSMLQGRYEHCWENPDPTPLHY